MLLADHLDRPAVRQRLMDGEIEARLGGLERRSVERAAPFRRLCAPAFRADVGRAVGTFLHEQELDATVGRSLQRLLPAGCRTAVPSGLLTPAREQLLLSAGTPLVE